MDFRFAKSVGFGPVTSLHSVCVGGLLCKVFMWYSQGEWGVTEADEDSEYRRRSNFSQTVMSECRSQLRILQQSYQVRFTTENIQH